MEIQLFQLENLFANPNRFLFFDLRPARTPLPEELEKIFLKAHPIMADALVGHLASQSTPTDFPIVLVCDDGEMSQQVTRTLEDAGYTNVYVIAGGVTGLLSEL